MLTNRRLARINGRPRKIDRRPLLMVGGGMLALTMLAALAYAGQGGSVVRGARTV